MPIAHTCFLRQGLSLNLELADLVGLVGQQVLEFSSLLLLSAETADVAVPSFLCGCWGSQLRFSFLCVLTVLSDAADLISFNSGLKLAAYIHIHLCHVLLSRKISSKHICGQFTRTSSTTSRSHFFFPVPRGSGLAVCVLGKTGGQIAF